MYVGPNSVHHRQAEGHAKNLGPLSVVTIMRLRRMQAFVRPRLTGSAVRLTTPRIASLAHDLFGGPALVGATDDQHALTVALDDAAGQLAEIFRRPQLGRAEGATGIEHYHLVARGQGKLAPDGVGCRLVGRQGFQIEPGRLVRRADGIGQLQIAVDRRSGDAFAAAARGMQFRGQRHPPPIAGVANALARTGRPGDQTGAQRIGEQNDGVGTGGADLLDDRPAAELAVV